MAQSIFDDLGQLDDNRIPGWSFIHYGASEIVPSFVHQSSEKKQRQAMKKFSD